VTKRVTNFAELGHPQSDPAEKQDAKEDYEDER